MSNTVNPQIVDSVTTTNALNIGAAPAYSMGLTYDSMANSISDHMQNAITNQRNMQVAANTTTGVCCALIVALGGKG